MALILINDIQDMILNNIQEVLVVDPIPLITLRNTNAGGIVTFKPHNLKSIYFMKNNFIVMFWKALDTSY